MSAAIEGVTMPKWGLAMSEGLVAAWHADAGATIAAGDELLDIETEKITNAYESPHAGVLRRQVVPAGEVAPVGALLAVVAPAEATPGAVLLGALVGARVGRLVAGLSDRDACHGEAGHGEDRDSGPHAGLDAVSHDVAPLLSLSNVMDKVARRIQSNLSRA